MSDYGVAQALHATMTADSLRYVTTAKDELREQLAIGPIEDARHRRGQEEAMPRTMSVWVGFTRVHHQSQSALAMITGVVLLLLAVLSAPAAHAAGTGYNVFVGYADNLRTGTTQSPTPWAGNSGVTFAGCLPISSCVFDAGAVRVANATALSETVDFVKINFDGCVFDIWPHNVVLAAGGQLILTQTASGAGNGCAVGTETGPAGMDSSDFGPGGAAWAGQCSQSGVIPQVTVSVNGTAATYADSGQVLNTNGVDAASCDRPGFPAGNESTQWVSIGDSPCATGAVLTLAPPTQNDLVGSTATVTANLGACGSPLQAATVNFAVLSGPNAGTSGSAVADGSGNASFSYSGSAAGSDTVRASVTNLAGTIDSNTTTVVWHKRPTTLTYNGASTSDFNDLAALSAKLTDTTTGAPVAGATVAFALNASETCVATTNAGGNAACSVTPGDAAGSYVVSASYEGDSTHLSSQDSAAFAVTREEAVLTSSTALHLFAQGAAATLSSTLTDPDGGAPIAGQAVEMTLGSGVRAQSCSDTTNASGTARCSINPVTVQLGPEPVTDSFVGNRFYTPATNDERALVFAYSQGGSFVLGDKSATGPVTFWDAQWSKLNTLSAGDAPAAFKGFEDTPAAPTCGTSWTTDPGNSTPPPAGTLPSYMAAPVASKITKSAATIAGNTVHVVIVKTNPGYAPNPGHAGTGTVVASLC